MLPGAKGDKVGAPVEINAQGMIDEAVPVSAAAGERRVLVVGGHETFGLGVPVAENFVHRLGEDLRASGLPGARTVNLSMYSYTLAQKVELACRRAGGLQPELVVLQVSQGDAESPRQARSILPFPRLKNAVRENSALARLVMERNQLRRNESSARSKDRAPASKEDAASPARELDRFDACVRAAGAKPAVVMIPGIADDVQKPSALRLAMESEAAALKIPFVDAASALGRLKPEERALRPNLPFLSPAAHKVLAEELGRRLKPLLKPRPSPPRRPSV